MVLACIPCVLIHWCSCIFLFSYTCLLVHSCNDSLKYVISLIFANFGGDNNTIDTTDKARGKEGGKQIISQQI